MIDFFLLLIDDQPLFTVYSLIYLYALAFAIDTHFDNYYRKHGISL